MLPHTESAPPPSSAPIDDPRQAWVPIRTLGERHRARVLAHLLSLNADDRYLRFGSPASDSQIERYVQSLDFARDEVFGIFNRRLELIAMAHLAHGGEPSASASGRSAEFGVSVLSKARGRGYGARLFDHAVLHAKNRGVDTLVIHALSENAAMLRIARNAGAKLHRDGSESQAVLKLAAHDLASRMDQLVRNHAAEVDYQWKRHSRRVDAWLAALRAPGREAARADR